MNGSPKSRTKWFRKHSHLKGSMGRLLRYTLLTALSALALPVAAWAAPEYEPNEGIHEAYGPLVHDTPYDATISSSNDWDWYVFHVSGPGLVTVELTNKDDASDARSYFTLRDADGEELNSSSAGEGGTESIQYTTPGAGTYYVDVWSWDGGNDYRLRVSGPLVDGPAPGAAETTPNNNPTMESAFGPLLGGKLYGGRIDAHDEEDWFRFYTAGAGTFDAALTNVGDESDARAYYVLYDEDGQELMSESAGENRVGHMRYTAAGRSEFFLQVWSWDPGNEYQFEIMPASLITTTPPPPPPATNPPPDGSPNSDACAVAKAKVKKAKQKVKKKRAKVKKAKAKVRSSQGSKRQKAKAKLKKAKLKLKKAKKKLQAKKAGKKLAC